MGLVAHIHVRPVDFAGFGITTAEAVDIIRRNSTVVVVGMGKIESTISTSSLILNRCHLVGSNGGAVGDVAGVFDLIATSKLELEFNEITWDQVPQALDDLKNHRVTGRTVIDYDASAF